ncbi:Fur family transcriptional regulator [Streptomyces fuscichromogenes]|uniref:Transcriptional repressor n=1 Tax=Streptomyces fuscichromogenes TaxID=1324013 RepID=A0A918CTC7_9ACTN|nr:transcriptional repressor [Streptomyces fuscichromogenes]
MTMEQPAGDLLKRTGLRSTAQRRAVLTALQGHPHSTAADLETRIGADRAEAGGLSRQGLYNVLEDLAKAQLVRCIEPAGSPARYELRVGDNHHHLVCRRCGLIEDVDCSVGAAPCLTPGDDRGFVVDEAEITWWGLCAECRRATVEQ